MDPATAPPRTVPPRGLPGPRRLERRPRHPSARHQRRPPDPDPRRPHDGLRLRRNSRRCVVIATLLALTAFASNPALGQTAGASGASPTAAVPPVQPVAPQVVHRKRAGLVIAGSVVFGVSWVPALAITATAGGSCDTE